MNMKLKMKNDRGLVFEAVNPDEHLKDYYRERIAEAYRQELVNFLQETVATLRKLKPGEKVTIYSKPIEVTLESVPEQIEESNAAVTDESDLKAQLELELSKLNEAVDSFAEAMKAKLAAKAAEGFRGWDRAGFESLIVSRLTTKANRVEFDRKQAVDIANLAMMLWWQSLGGGCPERCGRKCPVCHTLLDYDEIIGSCTNTTDRHHRRVVETTHR